MRSRDYNKRAELFSVDSVSDGQGGSTSTETSLGKFWCKLESFRVPNSYQSEDNEFRKAETGNAVKVTTRTRIDVKYSHFNMYMVYRGEKYTISTDPTNFNFRDNYLQFVAVRQVKNG